SQTVVVLYASDRVPTETDTLSLHDALPIYRRPGHLRAGRRNRGCRAGGFRRSLRPAVVRRSSGLSDAGDHDRAVRQANVPADPRSEEHTSELQSRENLVCRLLLEKKNKQKL